MNINPEKILELDKINNVIWKDTNSKVIGCNDKFAHMTGTSLKQIAGLSDYDLSFTSDEASGFILGDKKVLATRMTQQYHEKVTFIDGQKEVQTIKIPVFSIRGKVTSIIIIGYMVNQTQHTNNINHFLKHNGEEINPCETKILNLLVRGKTAKEIGDTLFLSKRTIETYLDRIKNKFNVSSKSQLISLVFDLYK